MPKQPGEDGLLSAAQVAEQLAVSADFVWRLARERKIKFVAAGRQYRFRQRDVDTYVNAHTVPALDTAPRRRKRAAS